MACICSVATCKSKGCKWCLVSMDILLNTFLYLLSVNVYTYGHNEQLYYEWTCKLVMVRCSTNVRKQQSRGLRSGSCLFFFINIEQSFVTHCALVYTFEWKTRPEMCVSLLWDAIILYILEMNCKLYIFWHS